MKATELKDNAIIFYRLIGTSKENKKRIIGDFNEIEEALKTSIKIMDITPETTKFEIITIVKAPKKAAHIIFKVSIPREFIQMF